MVQHTRRGRRALPPRPQSKPLKGLINVMILIIALTLILMSRCDLKESSTASERGSWVDYIITPKELRLPPSVTEQHTPRGDAQSQSQPRLSLEDQPRSVEITPSERAP